MTKKKKNARNDGPYGVLFGAPVAPLPPRLETMETDERVRKTLLRAGISPDAPDKWQRLALYYMLRHERDMRPPEPTGRRGRPRLRTPEKEAEFLVNLMRDVRDEQSKVRGHLGVEAACKRLLKRESYKSMKQLPSSLARRYSEAWERLLNDPEPPPWAWIPFDPPGPGPGPLPLKKPGRKSD